MITTLTFSHDINDSTPTKVRVEVEKYEYYDSLELKWITEHKVEFLETFDKSVHGMWQMELNEQLKNL